MFPVRSHIYSWGKERHQHLRNLRPIPTRTLTSFPFPSIFPPLLFFLSSYPLFKKGQHGSVVWGFERVGVDGDSTASQTATLPPASNTLVAVAGSSAPPVFVEHSTGIFTMLASDRETGGGIALDSVGKGKGKRGKVGAVHVLPSVVELEIYASSASSAGAGVAKTASAAPTLAARAWFHVGCEFPLHVGDRFGFVEIVVSQIHSCFGYTSG